jgi:hypothetical protein
VLANITLKCVVASDKLQTSFRFGHCFLINKCGLLELQHWDKQGKSPKNTVVALIYSARLAPRWG